MKAKKSTKDTLKNETFGALEPLTNTSKAGSKAEYFPHVTDNQCQFILNQETFNQLVGLQACPVVSLRSAARVMQIDLLDHIVIGTPEEAPLGKGSCSFKDEGLP